MVKESTKYLLDAIKFQARKKNSGSKAAEMLIIDLEEIEKLADKLGLAMSTIYNEIARTLSNPDLTRNQLNESIMDILNTKMYWSPTHNKNKKN